MFFQSKHADITKIKRSRFSAPFRLSIKWSEPRQNKNRHINIYIFKNKISFNLNILLYCESRLNIEFKRLSAFSPFGNSTVPLYAYELPKGKFSSISRSLPACRNLIFGLFLHAERSRFSAPLIYYLIVLHFI